MATPSKKPRPDVSQELEEAVRESRWYKVTPMVQGDDCSHEQRQWAVTQIVMQAPELFVKEILELCAEDQQDWLLIHLLDRRFWGCIDLLLQRGVTMTSAQRRRVVEEAMKYGREEKFAYHILPHCSEEELEQVSECMMSRGLWKPVDNVTHNDISITQHILSQLVSRGLWGPVSRFVQRDISSEQRRWAVEQASKHASDIDFERYILPQCDGEQLKEALTHLVLRGLGRSVYAILQQGVSSEEHWWVMEQAITYASDNILDAFILSHCSKDDTVYALPRLVANRKWGCAQRVLYDMVCDTLYTWVTSQHGIKDHDTLFWKFIYSCRIDLSFALNLTKVMTQETVLLENNRHSVRYTSAYLARRTSCQGDLCQVLVKALLHTLCCVMCSDDMEYMETTKHTEQCVSDIYAHINGCIKDNTDSIQHDRLEVTRNKTKQGKAQTLKAIRNKKKWTAVFTEVADTNNTDPLLFLHFLQSLNLYYRNRRDENDDAILLMMFTVFPLFPQLQSTALRMMLREKRWDVISQACLSHVWEHDRRQLFKAAVEQRQWDVVRQWSDHSVHDDQRDWAMKEAFRENEWEVYLLLADHGLTMHEHMHACYIVAKYGDWDTVLQMAERGGDITEVSNLLETWVTGNLRLKPKGDATVFLRRCEKLLRLRWSFEQNSTRSLMKSLKYCLWGSVLFNILHKPTEEYFSQVLHKVIEKQEWHILMHLVRLGMNRAERDWLFPQMVRQQQWGVCRKLLRIGVDIQLCLEALPELLERNQWTLVARVMEYSVDDAVICHVIQYAFQRREGVLFWHCLTTMENKERLSMGTRVNLFYQAISRDIWQAVKPLVEKQVDPGFHHRDVTFLEAIEQHLWDVVDYCQLQGADINMEDRKGETPLHREARKEEWKAVEEIVFRNGKPNLLDKGGVSVLNRLVGHKQWNTVKFVIKYGGNIHLPAYRNENMNIATHTPLQELIDHRQADVIQFTVKWCPEQRKGVNKRGETTLHAVCDSDRWDVMEDLMVRRVDPLAVTKTGQTALVYAVLNSHCPQRMVAECCRLGFSSHQPALTGAQESLLHDITDTVVEMWKHFRPQKYFDVKMWRHFKRQRYFDCRYMQHSVITSPLVCAVLRDLPVVILMLFESGSSSRRDMSTLSTEILKLTDINTEEGGTLYEKVLQQLQRRRAPKNLLQLYAKLTNIIEKNTAFMRQLANTPRSLLSSCRLLILCHFHFSNKKRQEYIQELPLPVPLRNYLEFADFCGPVKKYLQHLQKLPLWMSLKKYLEFPDFSGPDYGQHMTLPPQSSRDDEPTSEEMFFDGTHDEPTSEEMPFDGTHDEPTSEEMSSDGTDDESSSV